MKLDCQAECPFGFLNKLEIQFWEICLLLVVSRGDLKSINFLEADQLIMKFVNQLECWHLDCCDVCTSEPEVKRAEVARYCDFILRIMDIIQPLKMRNEGGEQCLQKKVVNA